MIRKTILIGVLCAVCLQAPLNVGAVELPIVPVEESQAETTTAVSETPAVTQKPAEQETPVILEAPATKKAAETTRASTSENSTPPSDATISDLPASENTDSETNELSVLSPDGESTAETSESSSDRSFSDEKDSSDMQNTVKGEIGTSNQKSENNSLPIIFVAIGGVVVLAGAAIFVVFRKRNKR